MFLLFLIGLGTADVNAQVRIGGNAAPNGAAVLDLNATDAATGTKGLALPRVNLTSDTMTLTTGVSNLNGMVVYNTTSNLGFRGLYYWNGPYSKWVASSFPYTSPADSGKILVSNGKTWVVVANYPATIINRDSIKTSQPLAPVSTYLVLDTSVAVTFDFMNRIQIYANAVRLGDLCITNGPQASISSVFAGQNNLVIIPTSTQATLTYLIRFKCYRMM